jgi:hypothetical protein
MASWWTLPVAAGWLLIDTATIAAMVPRLAAVIRATVIRLAGRTLRCLFIPLKLSLSL